MHKMWKDNNGRKMDAHECQLNLAHIQTDLFELWPPKNTYTETEREREIIHFERACVDRFLDEGVREGEREE